MKHRHGQSHANKSSLARRLTRLEDKHRRDVTRLLWEISSLRVALTPEPRDGQDVPE